jgi:hypothetical protein
MQDTELDIINSIRSYEQGLRRLFTEAVPAQENIHPNNNYSS